MSRSQGADRPRALRVFRARFSAFVEHCVRWDRAAYVLWVGALTIASARHFYAAMYRETGGHWSAPLDDVFIHFDYARATSRGFPFQWVIGNGYSSGNTSLLYPLVLG